MCHNHSNKKQRPMKITKSKIDFLINKDTTIRFVPMTNDSEGVKYIACVYYKGVYDGCVQNMRYTDATQVIAREIYSAYMQQENLRMSNG